MKNDILHEKTEYVNIRDLVEDIGERYRGRIAYTYRVRPSDKDAVTVNYEALRDDVRALSTALHAHGYANKHIAVIGKLTYPWVCLYYAVQAVGSVLVPLDRDWIPTDLADTVIRADVSTVFIDTELAETARVIAETAKLDAPVSIDGENGVAALIAEGKERIAAGDRSYFDTPIDPDRMSLLVFTSGTTGKGKGVMLSQRNYLSDMADVLPFIDFTDRSIGLLPPHHTYGSSVNIVGQNWIGCNIYLSAGLRYVTKELREVCPGHLVLVPLYLETFYRKILAGIKDKGKEKSFAFGVKLTKFFRKFGIDLRKMIFKDIREVFGGELRMVVSGGAHISQDIIDLFDAIGISVLNGYGITECAPIIAVNRSRNIVPGSVGQVLPMDTVVIEDPNENGEGEICVKGPNVMLGYYKDEEATRAAIDENGFFHTGDYGKIEKGALFITGRKKNLIILSNGKNVYPEEIETEFVSVPGVSDVVVYEGQSKRGVMHNAIVLEIYPDAEFIEKNGITDPEAHFQAFVNDYNKRAVPYKKIGLLRVRKEPFPKNTLRKIMRFKMDMTID